MVSLGLGLALVKYIHRWGGLAGGVSGVGLEWSGVEWDRVDSAGVVTDGTGPVSLRFHAPRIDREPSRWEETADVWRQHRDQG